MKLYLKISLLLIVVISYTNCSRRAPRRTGNGRRMSQEVKTIQPNPHQRNNTAQVNTVTPKMVSAAKPDIEQMKQDLVGHSLSEGVDDGYYSSDWHWIIREGEISSFCIDRVITESSNEYEINTRMRLTSSVGKAFDAKVRIRYLFSQAEGWYIQFAQSQGMYIVKTGVYRSCITTKEGSFGYFDVSNNCDIPLEVGGQEFRKYGGWGEKRSFVVMPHDEYGMICDNFKIDYVEIP